MSLNLNSSTMFGNTPIFSSSPAGGGGLLGAQQPSSFTGMASTMVSPGAPGGGYAAGVMPVGAGGGSPVFQSPSGNKFPAGGGAIVFTPHSNISPGGGVASATPVSPYSYVGGSATSFIQSPSAALGGGGSAAGVYSPPPYSSTVMAAPHHMVPGSPVGLGYGPSAQYSNVQPYVYGARGVGTYAYQSPYQQQHHPSSPYYSHHSPRDEVVEPMHCSPVGHVHGQQHSVGSPQYHHQLHRSPTNPPRPQYLPAYFTGIDHIVATVPPRPRRVFDRSPSTSPPTVGTGSRSPQSKSPNRIQQEGVQQPTSGYSGQLEGTNPQSGTVNKWGHAGQGPSKQLRFTDSQYFQEIQAAEEKEKAKKSGPPVRGFGTSEEISNFINSPLLKENNNTVPGAAIALEAVSKAGGNTPVAESNWITVFGFPAAAASFILTHFSQYGSVIQSKSNPGGNWLHIQYASRIDARRALACNGKVLGGTIMVGVITSPKEIIEMYDKSRDSQLSLNQRSKSPLQERNVDTESGKLRIRPLASTSQSQVTGMGTFSSPILKGDKFSSIAQSSCQDLNMSHNDSRNENIPMPTASSGILTKAMEYGRRNIELVHLNIEVSWT